MSRIAIPAIEAATGATGDVYAQVKKIAGGRVPNLTVSKTRIVSPRSIKQLIALNPERCHECLGGVVNDPVRKID